MKKSASSQSGTRTTTKAPRIAPNTISAAEFDRKFDAGEDVSEYIDWSKARRPGREIQRVNVDVPVDLLRALDREAARIGVARQAYIKLRIADAVTAAQPKEP
jgi:predicted DNA binding CopG/RHH family protein